MKSGHCLPAEVWLNIFNLIESKQQLAECKLVCETWVPLVERAMLRCVQLTRSNHILKLYQCLIEKPEASRYIQAIQFRYCIDRSTPYLCAFLTKATTPYLKAITAFYNVNQILDILVDIAAQNPPDYLKLEQIPKTLFEDEAYSSLVYQLRKTLRSLSLEFAPQSRLESIRHITSNLSQFKSLTTLRVNDQITYLDGIPQLDSMLKGCTVLKTLTLDVDLTTSTRHHLGNLDAWLLQNVQKVNSLKAIFIYCSLLRSNRNQHASTFGLYHVNTLRYLSFKYPNVQFFQMDNYKQRNQPIPRPVFENAKTVRLQRWMFDSIDHAQDIINIWKSKSNSLEIDYSDTVLPGGYVCEMNAAKEDNHSSFTLEHIPYDVPVEKIKQLVISLGKTLTEDFVICLPDDQEDNIQHIGPLAFLQFTPFIERLTMYSKTLGQGAPLTPLTRLHTLKLIRIHLTVKDVADIASWAPHLKHLNLSFCTSIADHPNFEESLDQNITLPELALDTLTMNRFMPSRYLYISLVTAGSQPQLFYAAPSQPIVRTTWEEVESRVHDDVSISIKCKSLKHLSVILNYVTVEMEFDEKGNVIESKPAIINSMKTQLILLETEKQAAVAKYEQAKKYLTEAQIQAIEKADV